MNKLSAKRIIQDLRTTAFKTGGAGSFKSGFGQFLRYFPVVFFGVRQVRLQKSSENASNLAQYVSHVIIRLIVFYQRTLSPDHGVFKANYPYGFCRHYPSCSEYTKNAVAGFGVIRGLWLGVKRILKCNPWVEPSIDAIRND